MPGDTSDRVEILLLQTRDLTWRSCASGCREVVHANKKWRATFAYRYRHLHWHGYKLLLCTVVLVKFGIPRVKQQECWFVWDSCQETLFTLFTISKSKVDCFDGCCGESIMLNYPYEQQYAMISHLSSRRKWQCSICTPYFLQYDTHSHQVCSHSHSRLFYSWPEPQFLLLESQAWVSQVRMRGLLH